MEYTKGDKTIQDYILDGGLQGKYFAYGWQSEDGQPAIFEVESLGVEPGRGLEATLEVKRVDEKKAGERESLNLAIHKDNLEVHLSPQ